jgi:hypothetical protein
MNSKKKLKRWKIHFLAKKYLIIVSYS